MKLSPPDPRDYLPSRAHPEHRKRRKELEKEHPFGLKEFAVLGLIGLTLAWDIEKQVQKREQRKDREAEEEAERQKDGRRRPGDGHDDDDRRRKSSDRERHRRGKSAHVGSTSGSNRRNYDGAASGGTTSSSSSSSAKNTHSRDPRRRQSVDYHAADPRYDDRYGYRGYGEHRRYRNDEDESRDYHYRPYDSRRDDLDLAERGRSRRDSW